MSREQPDDLVDRVVAKVAFFIEQFAQASAQPRCHAAHEVGHLLPRERELGLELAVRAAIECMQPEHAPRAVAALGDERLLDLRARFGQDRLGPRALERGGGIRLLTR